MFLLLDNEENAQGIFLSFFNADILNIMNPVCIKKQESFFVFHANQREQLCCCNKHILHVVALFHPEQCKHAIIIHEQRMISAINGW